MAVPSIPTTFLAEKSADPFPCIDNIWSIYSKKGGRTVFLSVGGGASCLPDLEIAETLGCPFNHVPIGEKQTTEWAEVAECLKLRARSEAATSAFSKGAEEKWILPKHLHALKKVPWWCTSLLDLSGTTIETEGFFPLVESICKRMNLKDGEVRLDILKLDVPHEFERSIIYSMLEAGLRPSMILVRWNKRPDEDVPTTLVAGHLQNCGYALVKMLDGKAVYYFMDKDIYMNCSWEDSTTANPLVRDIVQSVQKSLKRSEELNNHARRIQQPFSPSGETTPESSNATESNRP